MAEKYLFDDNRYFGVNGVFTMVPADTPTTVSADISEVISNASYIDSVGTRWYRTATSSDNIMITQTGNFVTVCILNKPVLLACGVVFDPSAAQLAALDAQYIPYEYVYAESALPALTLDDAACEEDDTLLTNVGQVTNKTSGSDVAITNTAGGLFGYDTGFVVVAADLTGEDGVHNIALTETHDEFSNSPRATTLAITVNAAA